MLLQKIIEFAFPSKVLSFDLPIEATEVLKRLDEHVCNQAPLLNFVENDGFSGVIKDNSFRLAPFFAPKNQPWYFQFRENVPNVVGEVQSLDNGCSVHVRIRQPRFLNALFVIGCFVSFFIAIWCLISQNNKAAVFFAVLGCVLGAIVVDSYTTNKQTVRLLKSFFETMRGE